MEPVIIEGRALRDLTEQLSQGGVYRLSVANDGGIKWKINEEMWTPAYETRTT